MHPQVPSPDLKGLALADLQRMLAQTDAAIAERRVEELKVLADGFARKLAASGFSVREGIDALKPYLRVKALTAVSSEK
jgi:DNA-binding protein H-NS